MSTPPKSARPAFPAAAVDRVFDRLVAMFGVQRMAGAWGGVPAETRHEVWGKAIARAVWSEARGYDLEAVREALEELASTETRGPPSSGEFATICERHAQRPGRQVRALPGLARTPEEIAGGAEQLRQLRMMLATAVKRMPAKYAAPREPGADDEPVPEPACTCWVGIVRKPTKCPACVEHGSMLERQAAMSSELKR
jgi:hypothetical protein